MGGRVTIAATTSINIDYKAECWTWLCLSEG